jgi:hypothetical protein
MFTFLPGYYFISNVRQIHEAGMLRENGLKVKAKVVSVETEIFSTEDGSATYYIPTVKYKTSDGAEYVRELQRHKTAYTENDEIEMLYYSDKGSEAIPNTYFFLFQSLVKSLIDVVLISGFLPMIFYVYIRKAILS